MLPGMGGKVRISIFGAGRLANALAPFLRSAGYEIDEVIARRSGSSLADARRLAKAIAGKARPLATARLNAKIIWVCVPDTAIAQSAASLAGRTEWKGKVVFHSSGALASDELHPLRKAGASVASVHPLMTFVRGSQPRLDRVPFAIEGDPGAVKLARRLVRDLGGRPYMIRKADKAAYHAWGTFASPLFTGLLVTAEQVATIAGVPRKEAQRRMIPILLQTLANYASLGPARAFSGPIVRGDVQTVKRHLEVLRKSPAARDVYLALARATLLYLPHKHDAALRKSLQG